jgi:hypothetical protein
MPEMGFEPTIHVFERTKKIHVSDRAATVNGLLLVSIRFINSECGT